MFILFDLMTLTYSATLTFPVALPDLYNASRAIYVPVRPIPALSIYKITSQLIEKPKKTLTTYNLYSFSILDSNMSSQIFHYDDSLSASKHT